MALQDRRVASLIQYAMKVEKAMFEAAESKQQYYEFLAAKIYRIRKELEERRMMKKTEMESKEMGCSVMGGRRGHYSLQEGLIMNDAGVVYCKRCSYEQLGHLGCHVFLVDAQLIMPCVLFSPILLCFTLWAGSIALNSSRERERERERERVWQE